MKVLATGFEPFGRDSENASQLVLPRLEALTAIEDFHLVSATLPVEFSGGPRALSAAIARKRPDAVICLGEAGGRTAVTPERWAGPIADGRIADNAGVTPRNSRLDADPTWLSSKLDADAIVESIRAVGVPAHVSEDAGTFVCNATYRALLRDHDVPGVFIHVPAVRTRGAATVGEETDGAVAAVSTDLPRIEDLAHAIVAVVRMLSSS